MTTKRFNISDFFTENVYHPDFTDKITADGEFIVEIIKDAVDDMLRVHATTGIDLTQWEPVLRLVTIVYPYIVIEGTGPTDENTVTSEHGETGRYWLEGDTSKPCNADAWAVSPDYQKYVQRSTLGWTR